MASSVAQVIANQIEQHGVERVYQVPGESFLGLLDALRDSPVQLITARQEGGAGWMALAEGRLTGRAGVAMVTRGPGAANAQIAIHTAYQDATPLVMFVGLIPVSDRDRESFQEFDPRAWFGSTAKAVMVIDHPDSAAERVARAFEVAESGMPGPVIIGLPEENLLRLTEVDTVVTTKQRVALAPTSGHLNDRLNAASRPVFVVGGDFWDSSVAEHLRALAEAAHIPVVSDFRSHDAFPHSSPAWVGSLGFGRNEGARAAYHEADLVCYLGVMRTDVLSDGFALGGGEAQTIVIHPDPELHRHAGKLDLHVPLSPAEWLNSIDEAALTTSAGRAERLAKLRDHYVAWSTPQVTDAAVVDREPLFAELQRHLPTDAIVTVGAGSYAIGPLRYLRHETPRTFVGPRNGAMGAGVPAAVAASLVHPDRTVVAFAGDGCFGMNGQEIALLNTYGVKAIVFVLDNGGYQTIQLHQEHFFPGRPAGTYLNNPDYVRLAEAHGVAAHRVDTMEGFDDLFTEALASATSTLFHVVLPYIGAGSRLEDGTGLEAR